LSILYGEFFIDILIIIGDCPETRSYDFIKVGALIKVKGFTLAERFMKFHSNGEDPET
jgi:hypothetical protein